MPALFIVLWQVAVKGKPSPPDLAGTVDDNKGMGIHLLDFLIYPAKIPVAKNTENGLLLIPVMPRFNGQQS